MHDGVLQFMTMTTSALSSVRLRGTRDVNDSPIRRPIQGQEIPRKLRFHEEPPPEP